MKEKGRVCQDGGEGRAYYATENRRRGRKEKHICVCMSALCVECLPIKKTKKNREKKQKEARSKETKMKKRKIQMKRGKLSIQVILKN